MDVAVKKELQKTACKARMGIIEGVHAAKSGHPGGSLSCIEILTYLYFKNFYQAIPTEAQIQWIQYQFQQALNRGFVSEELLEAMKNAKEKRDTRIFTLDQYLKQLARHRKNLVEDGVFYYHNELRITSLPPVVHYDIDSGELIRKVQPYFLEMVASYDIENLINYYKTPHYILIYNKCLIAYKYYIF